MNIACEELQKIPPFVGASHYGEHVVLSHLQDGEHSLTLFPLEETHAEKDTRIRHSRRKIDGHSPGSIIHLAKDVILTTLQDDKRLAAFKIANMLLEPDSPVQFIQLQFKGSVFSLESLATESERIVAAVSSQAEVSLIRCNDESAEFQTCSYDKINLDRVLTTTTFSNNYIIVFGIQSNKFVFVPLRANSINSSKWCMSVLDPVQLPVPPSVSADLFAASSSMTLSASFHEHCVYLLWKNGVVNIVAPDESSHFILSNVKEPSLDTWWSSVSAVENLQSNLPVCVQSFNFVLDGIDIPEQQTSTSTEVGHFHSIVAMSPYFVAISYGNTVAIWDLVYHIPHGYIRRGRRIRQITANASRTLIIEGDTLFELCAPEASSSRPPMIATASRRKHSCESIITSLSAMADNGPLRAHALTTIPISAAADAGGQSTYMFSRTLENERDRELADVRAVLSRADTPSAKSLRKLGTDYFQSLGMETGVFEVPRLPSDRLAAAFVARCLFELAAAADCSFVPPLIDMVGTGVVSAEGVTAALQMAEVWSNSELNRPELFALSELVPKIGKFTNVLEALVRRVTDLPEFDNVRIMLYAAWVCTECRKAIRKNQSDNVNTVKETRMRYRRAVLLLRSCLEVRTNEQSLKSLSKISFSDALLLLNELEYFLRNGRNATDEDISKELKRQGEIAEKRVLEDVDIDSELAVHYRGHKGWLDTFHRVRQKNSSSKKCATKGCLEWIGGLLDAHLTSLILDKEGGLLASQLLKAVEKERRDRECLLELKGMTHQIGMQLLTPPPPDKLYRVITQSVPSNCTAL